MRHTDGRRRFEAWRVVSTHVYGCPYWPWEYDDSTRECLCELVTGLPPVAAKVDRQTGRFVLQGYRADAS